MDFIATDTAKLTNIYVPFTNAIFINDRHKIAKVCEHLHLLKVLLDLMIPTLGNVVFVANVNVAQQKNDRLELLKCGSNV
ncbi:hypothetical protein [Acinetobacter sp. 1207_04]|uniref:hypothetical protein n=1 Tax=Acinetobacter sp. 1207_04 TaxID=2604449 RepID=UPI0040585C83